MSAQRIERLDCEGGGPGHPPAPPAEGAPASDPTGNEPQPEVDQQPGVDQRVHQATALPPVDPGALRRLGGIEVRAAVELGTAELLLRELAALGPGSVVRLDRTVGEPAELTVNGRLFARGELVVVGDHLALRITQLIDTGEGPGERT
jgi:flagellar motor switch protein FliN/FliY